MKWYENEEVEYGSRVWNLLTDESNLIKNHLELIAKNQELKSVILQSIELLSIDGKGTKQQVIKLLKEVFGNDC